MYMKRHRVIVLMIFLIVLTLLITACDNAKGGKTVPTQIPEPSPTPKVHDTYTLEGNVSFEKDQTITLTASTEAQEFNQFQFYVQSSQPLWGTFNYTISGESFAERFFIEATSEPYLFRSYIDTYIKGGVAVNAASIELQNRGAEAANVSITDFCTCKTEVLPDRVYVSNEYLKIGSKLTWGGGLDYIEYLKDNVVCIRDNTGDIVVGPGYADKEGATLITANVNLLNTNDTGRLVQQSYYGSGDKDYKPGKFMGNVWAYNPVQGGDQYMNASKIVDCVVTDTSIYIKCRPLDWALNNSMTPTYMEATYALNERSVVISCKFIDYSGYTHSMCDQELPAFYVIEPLNSFRYYSGKKSEAWQSDSIGRVDDLPFWPDNGYKNYNSHEYWSAWTNLEDDGFGVGLFVPGVQTLLPGVYLRDGEMNGVPSESPPTSYVAPIRQIKLICYKPLTYSYVISVGRVSEMREVFRSYKDQIDNLTVFKNYK